MVSGNTSVFSQAGAHLLLQYGAIILVPLLFSINAERADLKTRSSLDKGKLVYQTVGDGKEIYESHCSSCHQAGGEGVSGVFPPLKGSVWVTDNKEWLVRIILDGMSGKVEVKGETYNSAMPPWQQTLSDDQIAQLATYIRQSWGNDASEVTPKYVSKVREDSRGRSEPWTAKELKTKDDAGISQRGEEKPETVQEESDPADQDPPISPVSEGDYYRIVSLPVPEDVKMGVGGLAPLPGGQLAVSTRRGNVWLIENPSMDGGELPHFELHAQGLNGPLGLAYKEGGLYTSQRGELTRLIDRNGDDRADRYEAVHSWPLSKSYHGFNYGPVVLPNGDLWLTFNLDHVEGGMSSPVPWRGWSVKVSPEGKMTPLAAGGRSPSGLGLNAERDKFYTANQGGWIASGRITHLEKGDFLGHPASLRWTDLPGVPAKLKSLKPSDIPDTGKPMHEVAQSIPALKMPAVWLPHGILGTSSTDLLVDTTGGAFGPFSDQFFVGDQGNARVNRVFMEKVDGEYQGVAFPFREGFASGVFRLAWGDDNSLFVGMTDRGWPASTGTSAERGGLQRLVWTGKVPFEIEKVRAKSDGFELVFTKPVNRQSASDPASYKVTSFTYEYHSTYGSSKIQSKDCSIRDVKVSEDRLSARLVIDGLRENYIHKIEAAGVRSRSGRPLLHSFGYYTLNNIPDGAGLSSGDS